MPFFAYLSDKAKDLLGQVDSSYQNEMNIDEIERYEWAMKGRHQSRGRRGKRILRAFRGRKKKKLQLPPMLIDLDDWERHTEGNAMLEYLDSVNHDRVDNLGLDRVISIETETGVELVHPSGAMYDFVSNKIFP